jgi:hypothetical protein
LKKLNGSVRIYEEERRGGFIEGLIHVTPEV